MASTSQIFLLISIVAPCYQAVSPPPACAVDILLRGRAWKGDAAMDVRVRRWIAPDRRAP